MNYLSIFHFLVVGKKIIGIVFSVKNVLFNLLQCAVDDVTISVFELNIKMDKQGHYYTFTMVIALMLGEVNNLDFLIQVLINLILIHLLIKSVENMHGIIIFIRKVRHKISK
jgi:hypothetical protein